MSKFTAAVGGHSKKFYYTNVMGSNVKREFCGINCNCQKKGFASENNVPGYKHLNLVGNGSFGAVHLYLHRKTRKTVVIKSMPYISHNGESLLHAISSVYDVAVNIKHPNIVKCYNLFTNRLLKKCYIVMEYAFHGTLRIMLNYHIERKRKFTERIQLKITRDIMRGVDFLNANQLVHCNLKPENILVCNNGRVKITDFGVAHYDYDINAPIDEFTIYLAPELFVPNTRPNGKSEVWAIGMMLHEMHFFRHPFGYFATTKQYVQEARHLRYPEYNFYDTSIRQLLQMMLQLCPEDRDPLSEILTSKVVMSI